VLRVLPRLHEDINEEWISDKTRFAIDGLTRRRLDAPWLKQGGKLAKVSWQDAIAAVAARLQGREGTKIAAIAGDLVDCETLFAAKSLMANLGSANLDCRQDGMAVDPSVRASWLFNTTIAGIEEADACLLIGCDPRHEAALVNARLRKRWRRGGFKVASVGPALDLTFPVTNLGAGPESLTHLAQGQGGFAEILQAAERPMVIVGAGALARPDGAAVLAAARAVAERYGVVVDEWNGFNVLQTAASRVGALDIGFVPGAGGKDTAAILDGARSGAIDTVILLGADEIDTAALKDAFVIYIGHHGDAGAAAADVILPAAAYTEKDATYVNLEGRPQHATRAVFPPGEAREDWAILRALSGILGQPLPFDNHAELREAMQKAVPHLAAFDEITPAAWQDFGVAGAMADKPFASPVGDYYRTCAISRASVTMERCSAAFVTPVAATGTEG